jgi:hypothetical protein
MAKRKAARSTGRKATRSSSRAGSTARKTASRKGTAKRAAGARKAAKKASSGRARSARTSAAARKGATRKGSARTPASTKARSTAARKRGGAKKAVRSARSSPAKATAAKTLLARKAPDLNRPRRRIEEEEDLVPTPPSSLDLDRSASATRSGRRELHERYAEHTETSPALTGGDVDADWESAYSVGDEAPGGDNPTPDQDIVDDIGRAVGVEYQDNEELKGADKVAKRDKNRWELDPASSDDWDDR